MWIPNKYNVYALPNAIEFEHAFFMDDTTITVDIANWKYLKDVPVSEKLKGKTLIFPKEATFWRVYKFDALYWME